MLSFRKTFLLLAAVMLIAGFAMAQTPVSCTVQAGSIPTLRAEATADEVGQLKIVCTGGAPSVYNPATGANNDIQTFINVTVWLNTNITSRLVYGSYSEAALLVDDPAPNAQRFCNINAGSSGNRYNSNSDACKAVVGAPVAGRAESAANLFNLPTTAAGGDAAGTNPNVFSGRKFSENAIVFLGIPWDAPGTSTRTLRIVNVRANASALAPAAGSILPLNVSMVISISGTGSLNIPQYQTTVGLIQYGLKFDTRNAGNSGSTLPTFSQCVSNNGSFGDSSPTGCPDFRVRYTEQFATAFRPAPLGTYSAGTYTSTFTPPTPQNVPDYVYNTEHMFAFDPTNTAFDCSSGTGCRGALGARGWATQGTRLIVRLKDIPSNVDIYVSSARMSGTGLIAATWVPTDGAGQGGAANNLPSLSSYPGVGTCTNSFTGNWIPLSSDSYTGQKYATWEITTSDPSRTEEITFGVAVRIRNSSSAQSGLGTVTVTGNYAPLPSTDPSSTQATYWAMMSSSYPVPRFIEQLSGNSSTFSINPCRTNILFTYVTQNTTGAQLWDTGIAVANTLADPFKTVAQQGKCTVYFYTSPDLPKVASQTTNADVRPGDTLLFSLYAGGNFGIQPVKDFTGYIIVQCNFQGAHGYAFVSDLGATRVAEGYLGQILDQGQQIRGSSAGGTGAYTEVTSH